MKLSSSAIKSHDGGKRDKASVNYRDATGRERCGNCRYAYGPTGARRCEKVAGIIKPDDVCDLWSAIAVPGTAK